MTTKPRQLDGNVYVIDNDAVSVLVLSRDDLVDYMPQEQVDKLTVEELGYIAHSMTDALLGDEWSEALQSAIEANGFEIVEAE